MLGYKEARLDIWCVVKYLHAATTLLPGSLTDKQCSQVARKLLLCKVKQLFIFCHNKRDVMSIMQRVTL